MTNKIEILRNCIVEDNIIKLPNIHLDRKLYKEVAKELELIGGKWNGGKVSGFVFKTNPEKLFNSIINGDKINLKKDYQFYETSDELANNLVYKADLNDDDSILEPSAGQGAIIRAINKVSNTIPDCYELMEVNRDVLNQSDLSFNLIGDDFLKNNGKKYTKIIANPPFSKNQDIDHLKEMYNCLQDGGRLVCITSNSWVNGKQKKQIDFRNWLHDVNALIEDIPNGAFKQSGTMVGGKIIIIDK